LGVTLGIALLVLTFGVSGQSAFATQFERGSVFLSTTGGGVAGISQYSPSGKLLSTFGAGGAGSLCFDPNGRYLVGLASGYSIVPANFCRRVGNRRNRVVSAQSTDTVRCM
jgi:hypothetical protein